MAQETVTRAIDFALLISLFAGKAAVALIAI